MLRMTPTAPLFDLLRRHCKAPATHLTVQLFLREASAELASKDGEGSEPPTLLQIILDCASCAESEQDLACAICFAAHPEVQSAILKSACGTTYDADELLLNPQLQFTARELAAPLARLLDELSTESFAACVQAATENLLCHSQQFQRASHAALMTQPFFASERAKRLFLLHEARNGFPLASCMGKFRFLQHVYLEAALCPELPEPIRLEAKSKWMAQPHGAHMAFHILGEDVPLRRLLERQESIFSEAASRQNPGDEELLYLHSVAREIAEGALRAKNPEELAELLPLLSRHGQANIAAAFTLNGEKRLFDLYGNLLFIFDRRRRGCPTPCPNIEFALLDFLEKLLPQTFADDYLYFIRALAESDADGGGSPVDNDGKPSYAFAHAALQKGLEFNSLEAILDVNTERLGPEAVRSAIERRIRRAKAFGPALQSAFDKLALCRACPDSLGQSAPAQKSI